MKKTFLLLLAFVATLSFAYAGENPVKNAYSHHYNFEDFTALAVSNAFRVDFTFSDDWTVDVTVPDFIQPYLKVTCSSHKVHIGLSKLPKDVQRKLSDLKDPLQATVRMPKLHALSLSGASRMEVTGQQQLGSEEMFIDLSGASRLKSMAAEGKGSLSIGLSGASRVEMQADFKAIHVDVSGASKLDLTGSAERLRLGCSGASNCDFSGDFQNADIDLSGSSKMKMNGKTGSLQLGQSGATSFTSNGETARADVDLSGASKARLTVTERLDYELSGASTLRVKDLGARITGEQSRGSKIEWDR